MNRVRLKPVRPALMARSRAMGPREPCQDRKVAALSGSPHVLRGSLTGVGGRKFAGPGRVDGGVRGIFSWSAFQPISLSASCLGENLCPCSNSSRYVGARSLAWKNAAGVKELTS